MTSTTPRSWALSGRRASTRTSRPGTSICAGPTSSTPSAIRKPLRIEAIVPLGGPNFRVIGDLTLKDVTREIELDATVEGSERDPWGNDRIGIRVRGTIDRTAFGSPGNARSNPGASWSARK